MAAAPKPLRIEKISMLVSENGQTFAYTFQGEWLVGSEHLGQLARPCEELTLWSIARSEKGKFVAYARALGDGGTGSITIAATHEELQGKLPGSIYQELEIALGVRQPQRPLERPLDV